MGLAFPQRQTAISPLVKGFSSTRVVSVHTPNGLAPAPMWNVRSRSNGSTVSTSKGHSGKSQEGVGNAGTLQNHQGSGRNVLQRMRAGIRTLLGAANEVGTGADASRRSTGRCAATITTRPDQRLTPAAVFWFRNGTGRSLFPAPQSWAMHPVGRFEASYRWIDQRHCTKPFAWGPGTRARCANLELENARPKIRPAEQTN